MEKLTPFLAQTIKECIDISTELDESLLIKVRPNVLLHQALAEDELDLHASLERRNQMEFQNTLSLVKRRRIHSRQLQPKTCCTLWQRTINSKLNCKRMLPGCWGEREYPKKLQKCSNRL